MSKKKKASMIPRGCDADGGQAKVGLSRHLARLKQSGGGRPPKPQPQKLSKVAPFPVRWGAWAGLPYRDEKELPGLGLSLGLGPLCSPGGSSPPGRDG